jgi:hypothetical protein
MLLSLLIVLAIGLGLALFVWKISTASPVIYRLVNRSFWCPFRTQTSTPSSKSIRGVDAGSASVAAPHTPPSAITCDKPCLRLRKLDPPRDLEAEAERKAEDMMVQAPQSKAEATRVAEELLIELQRR